MLMNSLSLMEKNMDIGKQMSQMRNYINQLKDEIENELNNIGYDQLDADLRKRFDDMQTGLLTNNQTTLEVAGILKTQYLKADEIAAKYITAQTVEATYATITSLDAVSGRVGTLEADSVTVNGKITAIEGDITNLSTKKLDATTAYIDFMEVTNWVSAGYIKADKIDTTTLSATSLSSYDVNVGTLTIRGMGHFGGYRFTGFTTVTTTGGHTVTVPTVTQI